MTFYPYLKNNNLPKKVESKVKYSTPVSTVVLVYRYYPIINLTLGEQTLMYIPYEVISSQI